MDDVMMRVLVIIAAANNLPPLASSEELMRISTIAGVDLLPTLHGATRERVQRDLATYRPEVVVWIGHGSRGALHVTDDVVTPLWLAQQLANAGVWLALIAACYSSDRPDGTAARYTLQSFADALPAAGVHTVTMDAEVGDAAVIEYDVTLLQTLAGGGALRRAHETGLERIVATGDVMVPRLTMADQERERMPVRDFGDGGPRGTDAKLDTILERTHEMDKRLALMEERLWRLEQENITMREQMRRLGDAPPVGWTRLYLIGGGVAMTVMLILLVLIAWRLW